MHRRGFLALLIGAGLVGLLSLGADVSFDSFLAVVGDMSEVKAAAITALLLAWSSVLLVIWGRTARSRSRRREWIRRKRSDLYIMMLDIWGQAIQGDHSSMPPDKAPLDQPVVGAAKEVESATMQLMLWGSADVLQAFAAYRDYVARGNGHADDASLLVVRVLAEMRKDIGAGDGGLGEVSSLRALLRHQVARISNGRPTRTYPAERPELFVGTETAAY